MADAFGPHGPAIVAAPDVGCRDDLGRPVGRVAPKGGPMIASEAQNRVVERSVDVLRFVAFPGLV